MISSALFNFSKFTARKRPSPAQDKPSRDLRGWEWYYLWQQCQGEPQTILGYHADGATAAGFLPDGKTAYSAGNDRMVRLWDIASKKQVGLLEHESAITGCACSLDGRWLATSSDVVPDDRSTLRLWDLRNRNESAVLTTNFWIRPNDIVSAPDSKKLAFVDNYNGVRLWNLAPQREITNMPAYFPFSGTLGIAFSPDSRTLAYAAGEKMKKGISSCGMCLPSRGKGCSRDIQIMSTISPLLLTDKPSLLPAWIKPRSYGDWAKGSNKEALPIST